MITNACQRLIDTVFDTLRTYISRMIEKASPIVSKARDRAQELKVGAEQQVATAYGKATHLTKNAGHQTEEIIEESKEHLKEVVAEIKEASEQTVSEAKAHRANASTIKTSADKARKSAASKTGKPN